MNLSIDLGNTHAKAFLFSGSELKQTFTYTALKVADLKKIFRKYSIEAAIISSVIKNDLAIISYLKKNCRLIKLKASLPLPIKIKYKTPATLGNDRIACVVGARTIFPKTNVLVIDLGTCIKYDFINSKGEYLGGSISPGLMMRFKALHHFTAQLPLIKEKKSADSKHQFIGQSTEESILTGVHQGIINELNGFAELYSKKFSSLKVVITGGDAFSFAGAVNFRTFAAPDLIAIGLNEILQFNS